MTSLGRPSGTAKTLLIVAAAIVSLEALTFAVLAVLELVNVTSGRVGFGIGVTLFFLVFSAGLFWAAWHVARGDSRARSPLVFAQLIGLGLAWNFKADSVAIALAVAVPAAVALACLLAPPVTRALSDEDPV
ncbi:hypothetical protein [Aeromicrobium sp. UC242_57]|uniref:hypothetical protein n=1 Tax=Aeromicrobium sp. UC242_57 TaxID=3374624 RepID=UPI0037B83BA3